MTGIYNQCLVSEHMQIEKHTSDEMYSLIVLSLLEISQSVNVIMFGVNQYLGH